MIHPLPLGVEPFDPKPDLESAFGHVVQALRKVMEAEDALRRAELEPDRSLRRMLTTRNQARQLASQLTLDAVSDEFCEQIRRTTTDAIMAAVAAMPDTPTTGLR